MMKDKKRIKKKSQLNFYSLINNIIIRLYDERQKNDK